MANIKNLHPDIEVVHPIEGNLNVTLRRNNLVYLISFGLINILTAEITCEDCHTSYKARIPFIQNKKAQFSIDYFMNCFGCSNKSVISYKRRIED